MAQFKVVNFGVVTLMRFWRTTLYRRCVCKSSSSSSSSSASSSFFCSENVR